MIRPEPQVVKAMATVVRQHPELLAWIDGWYRHELESLPNSVVNPTVFQGRCQVLGELARFAKEAPALAAKL
jgi:hypothetical protein